MILYADTVGLTTPDEGIITASVGVTHANHDVKPVDETRKHSGIYDSTLSDGWATEHPSRLSDGQIGSSTELVNGKAFTTSGGEVFYTSDVEVYHTADTTDVGFMFNLTEEKLTDFIGLYVNSISGSATVTLYGANSQFVLLDSAGKTFLTSDGDTFITGDDPDDFFGEITSFDLTETGWTVFEYGDEVFYTSDSEVYSPSDAAKLIVLGAGGFTNGVSYKHYLVQFSGSFTISLGEVLLGQKLEPINPMMNRVYGQDWNLVHREAIDGTEFVHKFGAGDIVRNYSWDMITDKTGFERIRDQHKKFILNENSTNYFLNLDDLAINEVASGVYSVNVQMGN